MSKADKIKANITKIEGELKQNGEPTPSNPVDIEVTNYVTIETKDGEKRQYVLDLGKTYFLEEGDYIFKSEKDGKWYIRKNIYKKVKPILVDNKMQFKILDNKEK